MKKSKTKLCDLPDVLLSSIIEKLETQSNALRLRASCRKFQPLIPPLPNTLLERQSLNIPLPFASSSSSDNNHFHYSLIESKVFAIRPRSEDASASATTCWFIKVKESNSGQVRLMDPLSRFGFENASDKLKLPKCLNMLDYEVKELAQDYELEVVDKDENKVDETCFLIEKVVVSEDFEIMAMHDSGKVSVWRKDSAFANSDDAYPGWTSAVFYFDDYEVWRFSKFPSHSRIFWPPPAWIELQD
ncbi:uncharacterized protein LOC18036637 [Citrus clementina]|uniref:uncharacterized protein LOC18036637 n=1 Tax=Citrus clementina TaxID=85681 RepID=UPI000CED2C58|nr:uncharacterized protein LOC18036637 [Citrus x clementina]